MAQRTTHNPYGFRAVPPSASLESHGVVANYVEDNCPNDSQRALPGEYVAGEGNVSSSQFRGFPDEPGGYDDVAEVQREYYPTTSCCCTSYSPCVYHMAEPWQQDDYYYSSDIIDSSMPQRPTHRKRRSRKKKDTESPDDSNGFSGTEHAASKESSQGSASHTPGETTSVYNSFSSAPPPTHNVSELSRFRVSTSAGSEWFEDGVIPGCFSVGDHVIVDGDRGIDFGVVEEVVGVSSSVEEDDASSNALSVSVSCSTPYSIQLHGDYACPRRVRRKATEREIRFFSDNIVKDQEKATLLAQHIAEKVFRSAMTIRRVFFQFDKKRMTVVYSSTRKLNFAPLLSQLNSKFRCRIWLEKSIESEPGI